MEAKIEKQKNRTSTFSSPSDYSLPKIVSSESIIKSAFTRNSYSSDRNRVSIVQQTNKEKLEMKKNNQIYEAIRELICLGFYASNNLNKVSELLGEYEFNEKTYKVYLCWKGIFIKCGNDSLLLKVEDNSYTEYTNGPMCNDVLLYVNTYKNVNITDVSVCDLKDIDEENIVEESKIKLSYLYSDFMIDNPNRTCQDEFEDKRYTIYEPERFDGYLQKKNYLPKLEGLFSPEIILTLIEQVYPNFEQIYLDNKINGIIDSLSQEELLLLKQRIQEREQQQLVRKLNKK